MIYEDEKVSPALKLLIPFVVGILLSFYGIRVPYYFLLALAAVFILFHFQSKTSKWLHIGRSVTAILLLVFLGMSTLENTRVDETVDLKGKELVVRVLRKYTSSGRNHSYLVQARYRNDHGEAKSFKAFIASSKEIPTPFQYDWIIKQFGQKPWEKNGFDEYLLKKGVSAKLKMSSLPIKAKHRQDIYSWASLLREKIKSKLRKKLEPSSYAFSCAILLGDKTLLNDDIKHSFRASGVAHVLALSGLHTGIIYGSIQLLISLFSVSLKNKKRLGVLLILFMFSYAILTGASPSVLRAVLMICLFELAFVLNVNSRPINTLGVACLISLIVNPWDLFDIGFQFSYGAVGGILLGGKLAARWKFSNKILQAVYQVIWVSIAAQVFIAPLSIYYFGEFQVYFLLANLLLTIPVFLAVLLGNLLIILPSFLIDYWAWIYEELIHLILRISSTVAKLPGAVQTVEITSMGSVLLIYLGLILMFKYLISWKSKYLLGFQTWLIAAVIWTTLNY